MPMRRHEMVYVFYRKLPFYDLSSHKHKFNKETCSVLEEQYKQSETDVDMPTLYSKGLTQGYTNEEKKKLIKMGGGSTAYDPPLPVSVLKEDAIDSELYASDLKQVYSSQDRKTHVYDPPLPHSVLEIKSQTGKHSTQKPTQLIKWILKYYSKEGDVILDPTMGSGSTGVACQEMNRQFIGIEKDEKIFKNAQDRLLSQ